MKSRKRVYVRAGKGHKAYYREQMIGQEKREEIGMTDKLLDIPISQFSRLVSGDKTLLKEKYIKEYSYDRSDPHPKLEYLVSLMNDDMKALYSPPIFEEFNSDISMHKRAISQSISRGLIPPAYVMKDYPDFAESYEIDISDEAVTSSMSEMSGKYNHLYEMPKSEYDSIMKSVRADYNHDPKKVTDSMLASKFPVELEDTKRSAKLRKKIYNNLSEDLKLGYTPDTMDHVLHRKVVSRAIEDGSEISDSVKNEYPTLFRDVPFSYESVGDEKIDENINDILTIIRNKCNGDLSHIDDIVGEVIRVTSTPVPIVYKGTDKENYLISAGMDNVSNLCSDKLKKQLNKYDGDPVTIRVGSSNSRATGGKEITLSKKCVDVDKSIIDDSVIAHEYGHSIEYMVPEISEASRKFRARRTENEPIIKLNSIFKGYGESEITQLDHFMDAYIGKFYPVHTEILSMGMGYLTSKKAIERMYIEDPEYLGFIACVLSGNIERSKKIEKFIRIKQFKTVVLNNDK